MAERQIHTSTPCQPVLLELSAIVEQQPHPKPCTTPANMTTLSPAALWRRARMETPDISRRLAPAGSGGQTPSSLLPSEPPSSHPPSQPPSPLPSEPPSSHPPSESAPSLTPSSATVKELTLQLERKEREWEDYYKKIKQVEEEIKKIKQQLHQAKLSHHHPSPPSPPSPHLRPHHPTSPCPSSPSPPPSPSPEAATPGASGAAMEGEQTSTCNEFIIEVLKIFQNQPPNEVLLCFVDDSLTRRKRHLAYIFRTNIFRQEDVEILRKMCGAPRPKYKL
ncbi:hypothetical protein GBAR_LOCUS23773 [Geodia barretti]|uniref:Uncharacterized protein n=1 Tax=Geodia barretti TaxID=519541 RepID=A0AA35X7X1_GEOBA|nr:hypothetical protein GBAR_LOCUS23773 [Geodia barretti]